MTKKLEEELEEQVVRLTDEQKLFDDEKFRIIEQKSDYIDHIVRDIQDLRSSAFAHLGRNPIFNAILAPLGRMESISMLQHLLQLFNK